MYKFLEYAEERGWEKGLAEGKVEGALTITHLRNLMLNANMPVAQAMDALSVPTDDRVMYVRLLAAQ